MQLLPKINPTKTKSWEKLTQKAKELEKSHLRELFRKDKNRFQNFHQKSLGILLDYSKNLVDIETMDLLFELCKELKLEQAIEVFKNQLPINETENRKVLHTTLRLPKERLKSEEDFVAWEQREKMRLLCEKIYSNQISNRSGKKFDTIVNIGIGGSFLGPNFLYDALKTEDRKMQLHFVSNIDPQELESVLSEICLDTTLFVLVSKSFGTQETLVNGETLRETLRRKSWTEDEISKHLFAVTSDFGKAKTWGLKEENLLLTPDWVGGRFSVWGTVGFSVALAYGYTIFDEILMGANQMDEHFYQTELKNNLPILLALLGIWNVNFLGTNNRVVVPYDSLLRKFPSYLQQMIMESNGKSVDRNGEEVEYKTSAIYWGEIGTDAQHSFFQLLHQGNAKTCIDFLVAAQSKTAKKENHKKLQYNVLAQAAALAFGKEQSGEAKNEKSAETYKQFKGNTSSNFLVYDKLDAKMLGKLMALYEHQTFMQGVLWNIFSFDQWGVELGKKIANDLENGLAPYDFDSSTQGILGFLD